MNTYEKPEIEVIKFEVPEVITTSSPSMDDDGFNNEVVKP